MILNDRIRWVLVAGMAAMAGFLIALFRRRGLTKAYWMAVIGLPLVVGFVILLVSRRLGR